MSTELAASLLGANPQLAQAIEQSCITWQIIGTLEKSHYLAQISVESANFMKFEESLNYSVAGLRATFGRRRITDAQCALYGRAPGRPANQQAIANTVYGGEWGRINLGNTEPGDGFRYRGRGIIQLTGRANYAAYSPRAEDEPELLSSDPWVAADCAGWFWKRSGAGAYALRDDLPGVTRRINGGLNGLDHRREALVRAKQIFEDMQHAP